MYKLFGIICSLLLSFTACFAQFPAEELWHVELDSASLLGPIWQDEDGVSHFLISNLGSNTVSIISDGEEIWESQELPGQITAIHRVDFGVGDGPEIIVGTLARDGNIVSLSGEDYEDLMVWAIYELDQGERIRIDERHVTLIDNFENCLPDSSKRIFVGKSRFRSAYAGPNSYELLRVDVDNIMFDSNGDQSPEMFLARQNYRKTINQDSEESLELRVYNSQMELQLQRIISRTSNTQRLYDIEQICPTEEEDKLAVSYNDSSDNFLEFIRMDNLTTVGERLSLGRDPIYSMKSVLNSEDESVFLVCLRGSGQLTMVDVEEQRILNSFDDFAFSDFDIGQYDDDEELEMVTLSENRFTFYDLGELHAPLQPPSSQITGFVLHPAYPNPFNAQTVIPFDLATPSNVKVLAYDQSGRLIETLIDRRYGLGSHIVTVDASQYSSGNYFLKVVTDRGSVSRKITMIK